MNRDSQGVPPLPHTTEAFGRALHSVTPSSVIPTLADNDFIRDVQQQEKPSDRQQAQPGFHDDDHDDAGTEAGQSAAIDPGAGLDHHDNDPGKAEGITTSHPRLAFPSQAQIGGPAVARHSPGGAAVPNPITREQREADAARARTFMPYAAQVMWGVAL